MELFIELVNRKWLRNQDLLGLDWGNKCMYAYNESINILVLGRWKMKDRGASTAYIGIWWERELSLLMDLSLFWERLF